MLTLHDGVVMVVTDLHGDGAVYDHLKRVFLRGREQGTIDRWLLCGDLLHKRDPTDPADDSLRMLRDVMQLQAELGSETVIMLCGNHEMPHIYGQPLLRGETEISPPFEQALTQSGWRTEVIEFLAGLPLVVMSQAGVMLTHAGPTHEINTPELAETIMAFDHRALLDQVDRELFGKYDVPHARQVYAQHHGASYAELARTLLGASDETAGHYDHLLRGFFLQGNTHYERLWHFLFAQNEQILPNDLRRVTLYEQIVSDYLAAFSANAPGTPQHIGVSGHIGVRGGHQVVDDYHLRVASYAHAGPPEAGEYLLFDAAGKYENADDLVACLRPTFA
jgi:hypothetical protein